MAKKRGRKVPKSDVWERRFKEEQQLFWKVAEDEEFAHCMDKSSFKGTMYDPEKVISNYGRVWSLYSHRFIKQDKDNDGYFQIDVSAAGKRHNPNKKMKIHRLVANYFCNRDAVIVYGEDSVEVHHTKSFQRAVKYHETELGNGKKFYINYYKYLEWTQEDPDHEELTDLQRMKSFEGIEDGILYHSAQKHPLSDVKITTRLEEISDEKIEEMGLSAEEAAQTEHIVSKKKSVKVVFTETDKTTPELPKREELKKIVDRTQPAVIVDDTKVDNT